MGFSETVAGVVLFVVASVLIGLFAAIKWKKMNAIPAFLGLVGAVVGGLFVPLGLQDYVFVGDLGRTDQLINWGRYIPQLGGGFALGLIAGCLMVIANKKEVNRP